MYRVEDNHWWYRGLRGMIELFWLRYVHVPKPCVLHSGCGTGGHMAALHGWERPVGIDLSPSAIQFCRERSIERTAVASTLDLPFAANTFDMAFSMDVIQHVNVPDERCALSEMRRVLKSGGTLLLNVPAYQWLHSSHDIAVRQNRRFTRGEVIAMLRACDFEIVEATYWNALLFIPAATVRLWRKYCPPKKSDLAHPPGPLVNAVLRGILTIERQLVKVCPLPFGLSVFVVARKP